MTMTALVTGASSGIGRAFARVLASRGLRLILVARRADRLEKLAAGFSSEFSVEVVPLPADLSVPEAPARIQEDIENRGLPVNWLVNSAGYSLGGTFDSHPWTAHDVFLQVMVKAPAELCHRFLPDMRARGFGRIINIASLAALVPSPSRSTLYGGSKSFLVKFSQSLAAENREKGIHVTAVCPGFTRSEFHDVSGSRKSVSRLPGFLWMEADDVARRGVRAAERGRVVFIPGVSNRLLAFFGRHLPAALVLKIMEGR